jgi:hypothetical protein
MNLKKTLAGTLLSTLMLGCGAAPSAQCTAEAYPADDFATNASAELELRTRLAALNGPMKAAEADTMTRPTAADLTALYAAGMPSLEAITAPSYRPVVADVFARFEAAAGNRWTPAEPPTGKGGIYGAYIFTERGVDLRQVMEKGLFGAAHYAEAARLLTPSATVKEVDRALALFGANPAFPMDDKAMVNPDVHSAVYAKRRTNPAAATPGPYLVIKQAFLTARQSVAQGDACAQQRDEAFTTIRRQWERALVGTVVYYLTSAAATLEKASATDAEKAGALHGIGEAFSFLMGLRAVDASRRTVSDVELDQLLATLKVADFDTSLAYRYVTDPSSSVDALMAAIQQIQTAWSFSAEEINAFKTNY